METGNGRTIGETVHETAGLVELVAAMMHTNTEEVLALANKLDEHITDSVDYLQEAREVHDKLFTALADLQEKEG